MKFPIHTNYFFAFDCLYYGPIYGKSVVTQKLIIEEEEDMNIYYNIYLKIITSTYQNDNSKIFNIHIS